jgi:hypothetical protein
LCRRRRGDRGRAECDRGRRGGGALPYRRGGNRGRAECDRRSGRGREGSDREREPGGAVCLDVPTGRASRDVGAGGGRQTALGWAFSGARRERSAQGGAKQPAQAWAKRRASGALVRPKQGREDGPRPAAHPSSHAGPRCIHKNRAPSAESGPPARAAARHAPPVAPRCIHRDRAADHESGPLWSPRASPRRACCASLHLRQRCAERRKWTPRVGISPAGRGVSSSRFVLIVCLLAVSGRPRLPAAGAPLCFGLRPFHARWASPRHPMAARVGKAMSDRVRKASGRPEKAAGWCPAGPFSCPHCTLFRHPAGHLAANHSAR